MTISAGTRLGPYEILAPIGAGGMGEVYRARDPKLGREIAVKVLPTATASDPERRQRFELEARAASALNHPNILTVYDIGEADGSLYIAMELVEGRTLRELVASGEPLPTKKLLDLSVQIAEGLAKAHAAGIVHRDLKPENLMVSKDGYVKILDFGLAKLSESVSQDSSALPTAIAAPTQPGTVMGTAGYMSPEQASGRPVDYRSDQFNLGSILYEMATGKRAFQRGTGPETLVAVIRDEPEPLAVLAPKSPAPVRWIVERLLAKDPEERYASSKDLARDLKSVRDHLTETSFSGGLEAAEPVKVRRRGWALPALLALAAGIAAGFLLRNLTGSKTGPPPAIKQLTFARGAIRTARFAPDGQTIVYGAAWEGLPLEIFSTRADSSESRSLGLPSADVLAISSTGELAISLHRRYMFGFQSVGTLARVPLAGGAPREVLEDVEDADWSPDGANLAVTRVVSNRGRVEYPVGKALYDTAGWAGSVRVSPDGRLVAFIDHPQKGDNNGTLKVVDLNGKVRLNGPFSIRGLAWSPRGDEVFSGDGSGIKATTLAGKTRIVWLAPGGGVGDIARDGRMLCLLNSSRREMVGLAPGREDRAQPDLAQLVVSDRHFFRWRDHPFQRAEPRADGHLRAQARWSNRGAPRARQRARLFARRPLGPLHQGVGERPVHPSADWRRRAEGPFEDRHRHQLGDLLFGREADPHLGQRAGTRLPALRPGHLGRKSPRHQPGGRQLHLSDALPGREVGRGHRTGPTACDLPGRAGRAPHVARTGTRRRCAAVDARRQRDLRLPPFRSAIESRNARRQDGTAHALEGAEATGPVGRRAGRTDPDRPGRKVVRVFLSAHARRALSRDRNEVRP